MLIIWVQIKEKSFETEGNLLKKALIGLIMICFSLIGCNMVDDKIELLASRPQYHQKVGYSEPNPGNKFAAITVIVENVGSTVHHANPCNVTLIDTNDQSHSYDMATHEPNVQEFSAVDVPPGKKASGVVIFQIPKEAEAKELIYRPMMGDEQVVEYTK